MPPIHLMSVSRGLHTSRGTNRTGPVLPKHSERNEKKKTAVIYRQEELSRLRLQVAALEEQQAKDAEARQEELRLSQKRAAQQKLQLDELRQ